MKSLRKANAGAILAMAAALLIYTRKGRGCHTALCVASKRIARSVKLRVGKFVRYN